MDMLIVSYDEGQNGDIPMMSVIRKKNKDDMEMIVGRFGDDAKNLHRILTDQGCKFDIIIKE